MVHIFFDTSTFDQVEKDVKVVENTKCVSNIRILEVQGPSGPQLLVYWPFGPPLGLWIIWIFDFLDLWIFGFFGFFYSIKRGVILPFYTFCSNKKPEAKPRGFYLQNV